MANNEDAPEDAAAALRDDMDIYDDLNEIIEAAIKRNDLATVREIIQVGFKYRYEKPTHFNRILCNEGKCHCRRHHNGYQYHYLDQELRYPAFLDSIARSNIEMITLVLKAEPDLDCMNSYGFGPLHLAVSISDRSTRWSMVKLLMEAGATVVDDGLPKFATTCVHQAVAVNDMELMQHFLDAGAPLNSLDLEDRSLLHMAYVYNLEDGPRSDIVKKLIEAGVDVNIAGRVEGSTLLHTVAEYRFVDKDCQWEMMKLLLKHGAHLNIVNKHKISPLAYAAGGGNIELVRNMIGAGADVNISKQCTGSPLQHAVSRCNINIVKLLLEHGADIKVEDENGKNILVYATETHKIFDDTAAEYLSIGAQNDVYPRIKSDCKDILKMIIAHDVIMNHTQFGENMPFYSALRYGDLETVLLLMEKGVKLETCGVRFPLHVAAYNTDPRVLEYLLSRGLYDVDDLNDDGVTPLYIAVRHGQGECLVHLVSFGADVNIVCKEIVREDPRKIVNRTALSEAIISKVLTEKFQLEYYFLEDILKSLGHSGFVEFLLSAGANMKRRDVYQTCRNVVDAAKDVARASGNTGHLMSLILCLVKQMVLLESRNDPLRSSLVNHFVTQIPNISEYIKECTNELEQLKTVMMYGSTTLYDLLAGKDITCFINNQQVIDTFGASNLLMNYKIYGQRLANCVTFAMGRRKLLDSAKDVLNEVLGFYFDSFEEILFNIMSHLPIKDLFKLSKMCDQ